MRHIKRIVIHCTSGWNSQSTQSIKDYWKKNLGWKQAGYHKLISDDGTIENLAPLSTVTNGVQGFNSDSVHICYKGGLKEITKVGKYIYGDTRSEAQKVAIAHAISDTLFELAKYQDTTEVRIVGHRDLSPDLNNNDITEEREWVKVCPTFDAIKEYGVMAHEKARKLMEKSSTR